MSHTRLGLFASFALLLAACGAGNDAPARGPDMCTGKPAVPASTATTTAASTAEPPQLRLPDGARPVKNAATLTVVPSAETFDGDMTIDVEVTAPQKVLWLNADGLSVDRADVDGKPARVVPGGANFVGLALDAPLAPGKAR